MLFLVLFYVYPLKFLFNFSVTGVFLSNSAQPLSITRAEYSTLLVVYGLGFAAVYLALALLYLHAWRLRDALELNDLERFDTRYQIFRFVTLTAFGVIAAVLACVPILRMWSTLVYFLLFPILRTSSVVHRRRRAPYLAAIKNELSHR